MKIEKITLKDFKRFKDLTISDLPKSAKLVVLVGPNGCGKSSLFDAIYGKIQSRYIGFDSSSDNYYDRETGRLDTALAIKGVEVSFHGKQPDGKTAFRKAVYVRSAHRNDPSFSIDELKKVGSSLEERRITKLIDNDQATSLNYQRLISHALYDLFQNKNDTKTLKKFREEILADIQNAIKEIFPKLTLNSLGNPLAGQTTFRFDKGDVKSFTYENLSGGEKAAFDLILDLVVKRREYNDTVFCIDEPEAHMGMRTQQQLLSVLYKLIPDNCQLWIATHSIGMMRCAHDIQQKEPDKVVFLDFSDHNFDKPQEIIPAKMNSSLWKSMHSTALDDLAYLTFPDTLYLCESTPDKSFDADCYNTIFSSEYPEIEFASVGSKADVMRLVLAMRKAMSNLKIFGIRDRDNMTDKEIQNEHDNGMQVLARTCIEEYLLDDEILAAFCKNHQVDDENLNCLKAIREKNSTEHKKAAQDIRTHILKINKSLKIGDNAESFMKYSLAPLFSPDMNVYQELKRDIFDNGDK